jgi:hypothetical protein
VSRRYRAGFHLVPSEEQAVNGQLNELVLKKEGQTYIFRFDDASRRGLVQTLGRFAADPELNFSWHDAAVLCNKAREKVAGAPSAGHTPHGSPRLRQGNPSRGSAEGAQDA